MSFHKSRLSQYMSSKLLKLWTKCVKVERKPGMLLSPSPRWAPVDGFEIPDCRVQLRWQGHWHQWPTIGQNDYYHYQHDMMIWIPVSVNGDSDERCCDNFNDDDMLNADYWQYADYWHNDKNHIMMTRLEYFWTDHTALLPLINQPSLFRRQVLIVIILSHSHISRYW